VYSGSAPSVMMDSWEYGSVIEKLSAELPDATESDTWKLQDGASYDADIFYQPKVSAKFFNSKTTFEIPLSFTERQVKESFSNVGQLNGFLSMLTTAVENSMTVKLDALIMRTINNMIADTLSNDLVATESVMDLTDTVVKAVKLRNICNAEYLETMTQQDTMRNTDFIKKANYTIWLYSDRIQRNSTLFNVGGKDLITGKDELNTVLLSDFEKESNV